MKRILLIFLGVITSLNFLQAQSVNGIQLKELDVNYLRIYGRTNFTGTKMVVRFEFGQRVRFFDSKNRNVTDREGRRITFNTMIDALNFISAYGYRLVQTYNTVSGSTVYYHYIMEKIGLINNQGVNNYNNTQNNHYSRSINNDQESYEGNQSNDEEKYEVEEEKTFKERHEEKVAAAKKTFENISDAFKKKENKSETEIIQNSTETNTETEIKCSSCDASGSQKTTCKKDNCLKGKTTKMCSICNGNFADAETGCYKCEGIGCDYCGYDGKACDACKSGKKTTTHNHCKGTGKIIEQCSKCAGTGKIKQ